MSPARKNPSKKRRANQKKIVRSNERQALVILGMHRSGTSALTRTLSLLGAELPANLMGATEVNPQGFFESDPIKDLHESIFEWTGTSWHDLSPMPEGWVDTGVARQFADRMAGIVRDEFRDAPLFVVKDPRICRLVPFWQEVFRRVEVKPLFILPVRNPLEVAASLAKAQGIDESHGRLLWLQHVLLSERDTRNEPRVFLTYDQLIDDWRSVTQRIEQAFQLTYPRLSHRSAAEIDRFLKDEYRNELQPSDHVDSRADVHDWVRGVWSWVSRAAIGKTPAARKLDDIGRDFFAAESLFGPVVAASEAHRKGQETLLQKLRQENVDRHIELETTSASREDFRRRVDELILERDEAIGVANRVELLDQELAARESQLESAAGIYEDLRLHAERLERELDEAQAKAAETARLQEQIEIKTGELGSAAEVYKDLRLHADRIEREREELADRLREVEQLRPELLAARNELQRVSDEAEQVRVTLRQVGQERDRALESIATLENRLSQEREAQKEQLAASIQKAEEPLARAVRELQDQLQESERQLADERSNVERARLLVIEHEERVAAMRDALDQRASDQRVLEMARAQSSLDERLEGLTDSMRKLMMLWVMELSARGSVPEGLVESILQAMASGNAGDELEVEWVERALASGDLRDDDEIQSLRLSLSSAREELAKQGAENARLKIAEQELSNALNRLSAAELRADEWAAVVTERERELATSRAAKVEAEALRDQIDMVRRERDEFQRATARLEVVHRELRSNAHEAELAHAQDEARFAREAAQFEATRERVSVLEAEIAEIRPIAAESDRLRQRVADEAKRRDVLEASLSNAKAALERSERSRSEDGARYARERVQFEEARERLGSLREELSEARRTVIEAERLRVQVADQAKRCDALETKLAEQSSALEATERSRSSDKTHYLQERVRLEAALERIRELEVELGETHEREQVLRRERIQIESLEDEIERLKAIEAGASGLQSRLVEQEERNRAVEAELRQLPLLRDRVAQHEADVEKAYADAQLEFEGELREAREALSTSVAENTKLSVFAAEVLNLRDKVETQSNEMASAALMYEDLRLHADRLEQELENAHVEMASMADSRAHQENAGSERREITLGEGPGPFFYQTGADLKVAPSDGVLAFTRRAAKLFWWVISLQARSRMKDRRVVKRIRESGLFDDDYYRFMSPESPKSLGDPAAHYVRFGASEGRNPSAAFDTNFYLRVNPDVAALEKNPLDHFAEHGWREGRNPHPLFDTGFYLRTYDDVAGSGENPLHHWLRNGWREGRRTYKAEGGDSKRSRPGNAERIPEFRNPGDDVLGEEREQSGVADAALASPVTLSTSSSAEQSLSSSSEGIAHSERTRRALVAQSPTRSFRVDSQVVDFSGRFDEDDPVVLVVSHELPYPSRAGNQYRISRYIQWLSDCGNQVITIYSPLEGSESATDLTECAAALGNLIVCHRDGRIEARLSQRWHEIVMQLQNRSIEPFPVGSERLTGEDSDRHSERMDLEWSFCPDALCRLALFLDGALEEPAVFITNYVWTTRYLSSLRSETLSVIDTHDMFSSKTEKVESLGVEGELQLSAEQERDLLLRGDALLAIQAGEAAAFRKLLPERRVITAGVDFDCRMQPFRDGTDAPVLALIGSANAMNVKGINDFFRFAWPIIQRDQPGVTLRVAGAIGQSIPRDMSGVEWVGVLDSLEEFYAGCDIVINCTPAGTGLKIKTIEALAHGRRVVAWPLGVEGVSEKLLPLCHVARDWYDFARQVGEALDASVSGFSEQIQRSIEAALSSSLVYAELGDVIDGHLRVSARFPSRQDA